MKETGCRICGNTDLKLILSLGQTPLANALLSRDQLQNEEAYYPIDMVFCSNCFLVQITETVPAQLLFREYFYFSSFSDTMLQSSKSLVENLVADRHLDERSLVDEIASNDGYLLQYYLPHKVRVLGIEPAYNIAQVAQERGIPTLCEFFDQNLARRLKHEGQLADVIHANNVLAHVAALNSVVE